MAKFTRRNAWNKNGTFDNPDLLWYAKAVGVMQDRHLDDPTSWWFYAAIHGSKWPVIPTPPTVPSSPIPSQNLKDQYWDQCQHGSWFFPPWHRGYLYGIENILRGIIKDLGGPGDWALPYWNYFGPGDQYKIPPAFTAKKLPDNKDNPLFVTARYGPANNGVIVIPIAAWDINQECQKDTDYIGGNNTGTSGDYGGAVTGFAHTGSLFGDLEWNPHNFVHGAIGGQNPVTGAGGLMGNPRTAALDPVFYLHHCNIDRMWAAWNAAGKKDPSDANWVNGPTATGERKFFMPKPDKTAWPYTPGMVNDIAKLDYTYSEFTLGVPPAFISKKALRLHNFGLPTNEIEILSDMNLKPNAELVGANNKPITLDATGARTTVALDSGGWNTVNESISKTFAESSIHGSGTPNLPDEVFLQLEGVKGKEDSIVCSVSVNHQYVGHISLFGLQNATEKDDHKAGSGLTIRLDITKVVDKLHFDNEIDINSLDVLIQPVNRVAEGNEITIDRVSIYRQGQS